MSEIKSPSGHVLELKEGVVLNEDGSEARGRPDRNWLLGIKPGQWMAGILAAFAIPALFLFGLLLIGGVFSLIALFVLLQPIFGHRIKVHRPPGA